MSFADLGSPAALIGVLGLHRNVAYLVFFLGSFCETLIPLSFVVYGEIFFITGAILAGTGMLDWWAVATALYSGGILGDNASYLIGRLTGLRLFSILSDWPFIGKLLRRTDYSRGVAFFDRHGAPAVFLARLAGPLSWTIPCLAGAFRLDYRLFLVCNTCGVLVGIGQFLVLGYLIGDNLDLITELLRTFGTTVLILIAAAVSLYFWRRRAVAGQR